MYGSICNLWDNLRRWLPLGNNLASSPYRSGDFSGRPWSLAWKVGGHSLVSGASSWWRCTHARLQFTVLMAHGSHDLGFSVVPTGGYDVPSFFEEGTGPKQGLPTKASGTAPSRTQEGPRVVLLGRFWLLRKLAVMPCPLRPLRL